MRHGDYVAARTAREPRFAEERAAAAAELEAIRIITERREALEWPRARLAEATGIPDERLEAIEEGDSVTINEALWLSHALGITVTLRSDLTIEVAPAYAASLSG